MATPPGAGRWQSIAEAYGVHHLEWATLSFKQGLADALRLLPSDPRPDRHPRRRPRPGTRGRAAGTSLGDDRRPHRLPGNERVRISLHAGPQASERRRLAGDLLDPGRRRRGDRATAAGDLGAGAALPQP